MCPATKQEWRAAWHAGAESPRGVEAMGEPTPSRTGRDSWGGFGIRMLVVMLAVILLGLAPSRVDAQSPPAAPAKPDPLMEPTLPALIVGAFVRSPDDVAAPARPRLLDYFVPDWREQLHALPPFFRDTDLNVR